MRFTCREIKFGHARTTEREAANADAAAEQVAKAMHGAWWSQLWRSGNDSDGEYTEHSIHEGKRCVATVRVYPIAKR